MTWHLLLGRQLFRGMLGFVLILAATVAFGQATVVPPDGSVTIQDLKAKGDGCPNGTVAANISQDNQSFTLAFSEYIAEIGLGVPSPDRRKFCNITVKLAIPAGFQYSIVNVDYRGFADLDEFVQGTVQAAYFLQGDRFSVKNKHVFEGPMFENYEERDTFATLTFSRCGGGKSMNFRTAASVRMLPGSSRDAGGAMTVDTITGTFDQRYALVWQAC